MRPSPQRTRPTLNGLHRLLGLPEIQREEILAQREDEIQRWRDRVALEKLVKSQNGMNVDKEDSSAKRTLTHIVGYPLLTATRQAWCPGQN